VLGKISGDRLVEFHDASQDNLVAQVSRKQVAVMGDGSKRVVVIDCGVKRSIQATLVRKDCTVMTVPWDYDVEELLAESTFDGVVISNGPGNPQMVPQTIETVSKLMAMQVPILGICLGNQILSLAAGGDTNKLKFGHRSQNQPCLMRDSQRCYLTTQNHGFAVSEVPEGFEPWFVNANDGSNEGIIHSREPWMAVQFHPEAMPGPTDTEWVFDYWLERI
jgi:carbamoyl-phosphate synthase small subunit